MTEQQKRAIEWALAQVGCGYIYGATGWVCTEARRQQQAAQYPEYKDSILGTGAKWDGKVCYDCAQITRIALKQAGITLPSGATSQWNSSAWKRKGTIDTLPSNEPVCLYRQSGSKMQHTGLSLGDGTFVHAKGTSYGVLHEDLSKYPWTHWASPWDDDGGGSSEGGMTTMDLQMKVAATKGSTVRMRSSTSTTADNVVVSIPVGATVIKTADVGDWSAITYGGKSGYMMSKYLTALGASTSTGGTESSPEVTRAEFDAIVARIEALEGSRG